MLEEIVCATIAIGMSLATFVCNLVRETEREGEKQFYFVENDNDSNI